MALSTLYYADYSGSKTSRGRRLRFTDNVALPVKSLKQFGAISDKKQYKFKSWDLPFCEGEDVILDLPSSSFWCSWLLTHNKMILNVIIVNVGNAFYVQSAFVKKLGLHTTMITTAKSQINYNRHL